MEDEEYLYFNINYYVWVKLTDLGVDELKRQHRELKDTFPNLGEFVPPKTDADGYSKFQMHSLMNRFGHMLGLGFSLPFDAKIKIRSSKLKAD